MSILLDITRRQAKLVELMARNEKYMPAKYYANRLNISQRTIFNDLKGLEEVFNRLEIEIHRKPNQGIKLHGEPAAVQRMIYQLEGTLETPNYSSLERQIVIFRRLFMEGQTVTYQSLSLDLYISTTSIIKDINRIRKFMDDEVRLVSDIKGTRIHGEEITIQKTVKRFAYYLIEQKVHNFTLASYAEILEPLFTKNILDTVYKTMDELVSVLDLNISEQYLKSFFISLLILTERAYRGYHLTTMPDVKFDGAVLTNYPLAVQISHRISSSLSFNFNELEHQHISNQLFAHRIEAKLSNKYIKNILSEDISQIIDQVSKAINIDLTTDDKLYNALIYHMFPMIYRLKSNINIYNPLLGEIKSNYGVLFRILWYVLEDFEKKYEIKLTDDDVAFITIHFRVAIERKEQMSKVLIVCQTGLVTSDLIMNRIKSLLPASVDLRLVAKSQLNNEDLSEVDFIISSVQLEDITQPIVYVSPLVSDEELIGIYSTYLKHSSTQRKREESKLNSETISNYFNDRYIFLQENVTTKEECLDTLIDVLEKDGVVKKDFKTSVFEREKLGNTMVKNWVAVPHALSSMANETRIAIMTTKKPIKWNDDYCVSLIILLAVAEKDVVNIRKLLGKLYEIIYTLEKIYGSKLIMSFEQPEELITLFQDKSTIS